MDNRDVLIWLNSISGVGSITIDKLEQYFGELSYLWEVSSKELSKINGLNKKTITNMINNRNSEYYNEILQLANNKGVNIITIYDNEYPNKLKNIYNEPKVLYVKGSLSLLDKPSLAIVGSRKATYYGKWVAEKISKELSRLGVSIVSGMALGIDAVAHQGAINESGETVAVLGSGVDNIYPKRNKKIYYDILEKGCILSEYPIGMKPVAGNFPQRNRIISGLSLGVIIIEAKEKSGSLITAYHAMEQGKEVFAVPGNINSIYSKGTNLLIKDGAKMVTNIEDILEEIIELKDLINKDKEKNISYKELSEEEQKIINQIENGPIHCDMIAYNTGISITQINSILTILQMKNIIKRLPGNIYTIVDY